MVAFAWRPAVFLQGSATTWSCWLLGDLVIAFFCWKVYWASEIWLPVRHGREVPPLSGRHEPKPDLIGAGMARKICLIGAGMACKIHLASGSSVGADWYFSGGAGGGYTQFAVYGQWNRGNGIVVAMVGVCSG